MRVAAAGISVRGRRRREPDHQAKARPRGWGCAAGRGGEAAERVAGGGARDYPVRSEGAASATGSVAEMVRYGVIRFRPRALLVYSARSAFSITVFSVSP
jgi:hypothetical protein